MNPRYRLNVDSLRDYFLSNARNDYNEKQVELINILSNFLVNIVQDETCINGKKHLDLKSYPDDPSGNYSDKLHDILCETTTAFVPIPLAETLTKKANLMVNKRPDREGSYGEVFYMSVNSNPSIVKKPKEFDAKNLHEIFVNMFIINLILLQGIFDDFTYIGKDYRPFQYILCPTSGDQSPMKSLCRTNKPTIFMIQEKIEGQTYGTFLENPRCDLTMEEFKYHLEHLFSALIVLQQSPFELSHNDFHIDNIMIKPKRPGSKYRDVVILDFGMSSFSFAKNGRIISFQPWIYDAYFGKGSEPIITGAVDFFQFFFNVIDVTKNSRPGSELYNINRWCNTIANQFSSQFVDSRGNRIRSFLDYKRLNQFFLLDILAHIEIQATPSMRSTIRARNIKTLKNMTYCDICDSYFGDFMDYEYLELLTFKLYEPDVFPFISLKPLKGLRPNNENIDLTLPVIPNNPHWFIQKTPLLYKPNDWYYRNPNKINYDPKQITAYINPRDYKNGIYNPVNQPIQVNQQVHPRPIQFNQQVRHQPIQVNQQVRHLIKNRVHRLIPNNSSRRKNKKANKRKSVKKAKAKSKSKSKSKKNKCKCKSKIASGVNKGKLCNRPCKLGKKCGIHS